MATDVFGVVFRGRVESSQCRGESKVAHRGILRTHKPLSGEEEFWLFCHAAPDFKIPAWWRRAVLPSLPWAVCFLSFFQPVNLVLRDSVRFGVRGCAFTCT